MKDGIKSTEFYVTLGNMVAGILVMLGILAPGEQADMGELIAMAIGGIVAVASLITYIISRTDLKKTQYVLEKQGNPQG